MLNVNGCEKSATQARATRLGSRLPVPDPDLDIRTGWEGGGGWGGDR